MRGRTRESPPCGTSSTRALSAPFSVSSGPRRMFSSGREPHPRRPQSSGATRTRGTPPLPRILPPLAAAVIAAAYVIVAPRSEDLAAHLLRAKLFATEGFGIWNNWWYGGGHAPRDNVLFPPPLAAL